jgi:hypothetical protein
LFFFKTLNFGHDVDKRAMLSVMSIEALRRLALKNIRTQHVSVGVAVSWPVVGRTGHIEAAALFKNLTRNERTLVHGSIVHHF